ncbi:uncharacterized protein LOC128986465 [Macrosteles quadrilineatus]|uniref:uncharacterized protein LOC128986465 n=1 Tax=Macrosteles quadrilineatus TaxID=74068 RepID=UPI0023E1D0C5|nr:uncharacterized protein LOC128986465 [Macrosteles quadrilineatus]XP_054262826.1 uncharacterized protein LOC128986465 [Macrosteles quadrilineatus]
MTIFLPVAALLVTLGCVFGAGDVPKCDKAITSKMIKATDIIPTIQKNGQYSYVVVSSDEAKVLGIKVKCIGIKMANPSTVQVNYKLSSLLPSQFTFPVREEEGVLIQKDSKEYKLYVMYMGDGVIFTYRCCDTCTSTKPNVGIAVANKLQYTPATKSALKTAKEKMNELNLGSDVTTLPYC